jgi:hypothetical protein
MGADVLHNFCGPASHCRPYTHAGLNLGWCGGGLWSARASKRSLMHADQPDVLLIWNLRPITNWSKTILYSREYRRRSTPHLESAGSICGRNSHCGITPKMFDGRPAALHQRWCDESLSRWRNDPTHCEQDSRELATAIACRWMRTSPLQYMLHVASTLCSGLALLHSSQPASGIEGTTDTYGKPSLLLELRKAPPRISE